MTRCTVSASGNSASGHPQHLVGDSFDCCTERYEIVVYCLKNYMDMRYILPSRELFQRFLLLSRIKMSTHT